jgi:hypothetical protein
MKKSHMGFGNCEKIFRAKHLQTTIQGGPRNIGKGVINVQICPIRFMVNKIKIFRCNSSMQLWTTGKSLKFANYR